jgi:hypothetical protein
LIVKGKSCLCCWADRWGKIKRGYANVIDDYSAKSIKPLFDEHISTMQY